MGSAEIDESNGDDVKKQVESIQEEGDMYEYVRKYLNSWETHRDVFVGGVGFAPPPPTINIQSVNSIDFKLWSLSR